MCIILYYVTKGDEIVNDSIVSSVTAKMIQYFGTDIKRINHSLKVYGFAKSIGELESIGDDKLEILQIAAILHDIGITESLKKYNSSSGEYQEIEGPPVACDLLKDFHIKNEVVDRICYIIGNHHSYSKIDGIDFQILVEADFLVNIFEDTMSNKTVKTVEEKYFKTKVGLSYLKSMYKGQN